MPTNNPVDLDLIDKVYALIPETTRPIVIKGVVAYIVDNMPGTAIEKLTGDYDDFDKAEQILMDYYSDSTRDFKELLIDSFGILGDENVLYYLDLLQLDKVNEELTKDVC